MGERIESFRDLRVYKAAFELQQEVFRLTRSFPKEERYALVDQMRRSSRSVGSNIAEAWHKRRYPSHFVSKLTDADGEQAETQHWLDTSLACEYVDKKVRDRLVDCCRHVGRMLSTMMNSPEKWCHRASDQ